MHFSIAKYDILANLAEWCCLLIVTKQCLYLVDCRHHFRYLQAELRARFDEHKDELDMVKAKKILEDAERRFKQFEHIQPIKCMFCF